MKFSLRSIWQDVWSFIPMCWAILRRKYPVPWNTLLWVIVCAVYLVSPIDALPDVLPIIGITDDGAFVVWVLLKIHRELEAFRQFQHSSRTIIEAEVTHYGRRIK